MTTGRIKLVAVLLLGGLTTAVHGLNDTSSRAMGLAQSYTALARGPESVFWNPANLALGGGSGFSWDILNAGFTLIAENNSFSVKTYNDNFTDGAFIPVNEKDDLLGDIKGGGFKVNMDFDLYFAALVPLNGGVTFGMPWGIQSAIVTGLATGFEGEVPKDIFDLMLFGNDFNRTYDIAKWDGSGWGVASLNWAGAKAWMPPQADQYLSEFTVGGTLKFMTGAYGEVKRSSGGFVSYFGHETESPRTSLDAYVVSQYAGGNGFGIDLGVAGVTKDKKTTFSVALLNLLDTMSWGGAFGVDARQDSVFAKADTLLATRLLDVKEIEEVLDNPVDEDGKIVFREELGSESFSRSVPAMLRIGGAHQLLPKLTVVGNYDQAFTEGFGIKTAPRLSAGVEYTLVPWFPTRFGLSVGGRGASSAIGFGFGPFNFPHTQLELMNLATVTRGGFLPGVSKGVSVSLMFFQIKIT